MHFGLTEEQLLLQDTLRRMSVEQMPADRRRECFDAGSGFDEALWQAAAQVGLPGLVVPEEYGGAGLELLDLALAFEVLGEEALPGPFLGHALATLAIARGGSPAQRERWLPRLASGEAIGGCALAEGGGGWQPQDWRLVEEAGQIRGRKRFAEIGPRCDLVIVGLEGGALALVEPQAPGAEVVALDGIDRSRPLADLVLEAAPCERLDGAEGLATALADAGCVLLAADALGAAWKLVRTTVEYALVREQFGTPIAQFQGVKHQLADMAMAAEPMRGLVWHAAYVQDHRPEAARREAATAKAHVTEQAVGIGRQAVQLHGGIGFTWECDVQFWVKRTMHDRTWLGAPEGHRARIADLAGW